MPQRFAWCNNATLPAQGGRAVGIIALMTHVLYGVHNNALLIGFVTLYHSLVSHVI